MTVEVLKSKIDVVERDTDKLTEGLEHVRDKVNEIDRKVVEIDVEQKNQSKALEKIQKLLFWLLCSILLPIIGAIVNFLLRGGFAV